MGSAHHQPMHLNVPFVRGVRLRIVQFLRAMLNSLSKMESVVRLVQLPLHLNLVSETKSPLLLLQHVLHYFFIIVSRVRQLKKSFNTNNVSNNLCLIFFLCCPWVLSHNVFSTNVKIPARTYCFL